jgi:hypothetical protein
MPTARREGLDYVPDMSLVLKCYEIIKELNPRCWVIENVSGSSKFISKALNQPPWQIIGPFFCWGRFPFIQNADTDHSKRERAKHSSHPLRAVYKAKIPISISESFLDALTNQTTLRDFYQ